MNDPLPAPATFLFTDIEGSTRLARLAGTARWLDAIGEHHRIVGEAIAANGGRVDRTEGDAFVAVFMEPVAALAAATRAQRGLAQQAWPEGIDAVRVRMGLHTGVATSHGSGYLGLDAHLAARVADAANGGQILLTSATARALDGAVEMRDLGAHRLRDFPEPERLYHVVLDGDAGVAVPAPRSASVRATNLPPQTRTLLGRTRERAVLSDLLASEARPIVTLVGSGGVGKTHLAVAVATELLDEFPGGAFLVRLAGVRDGDSILPMIAEAVGVTGQSDLPLAEVLAVRLGEEPTLVVLDNFEQLTAASGVLTGLLERSGRLRLLVTSQVPLRMRAERVVVLGPLGVEDGVALFNERARAVVPDFEPAGDALAAIEDICARLDGMPLAIELAAARVGAIGPRELERRLVHPLRVLTRGAADAPERQHSLRATIDWTHALLDPGSQALFARLGVCVGAVPLSMVEAIGEPQWDTLDRLEELLEFSFVRRQENRRLGIRFQVPQALRDFALERLAEVGEEESGRRRHAERIAELARAARLWKWGATDDQRLDLQAVLDEIRPAVAWARDHHAALYVRVCADLAQYWVYSGVLSEVTEELRRARDSDAGAPVDRAWVLALLAKCAQLQGAEDEACDLAERALAEWRAVDDEDERALALPLVGWVFTWARRHQDAIALAEESLAILRRTGERRLTLRGLVFLAHVLADSEDADATDAVLVEADQLAHGDPVWELAAIRADCASYRGDHTRATELYAESLSWTSTTGESHQMLMDLRCLAASLSQLDDAEAAIDVFELVRLEEERTGRTGNPTVLRFFGREHTAAQERAGPEAAGRAAARAQQVPAPHRAARAIELAQRVLANRSIQD